MKLLEIKNVKKSFGAVDVLHDISLSVEQGEVVAIIGPSGSGKSFHMNSVVRQLLEQNTDVVMVDTGDSYEGICGYYKGTYIAYSKEKPISMNPFKVTKEEYELNFGEKKNFLKSLIFLIFKGLSLIHI